MVDLDLYRIFYIVAKYGNLTKASEELFISQPAVSQAIRKLEEQLGGKLFDRKSRGIVLTETGGKQMFEIVQDALNMLKNAEVKFKEMKNSVTGNLRISAANSVITHFLMRYIKKYHEMYPNVRIMLKDATTKETVDAVKENRADIGFVNLPVYDKDIILTGQTGEMDVIFVASEKYADLFGKEITLKEVVENPILMLDTSTVSSKEIYSFFESMDVHVTPEFEVSSVELLTEMAKSGFGIACIPRRYILEQLEKKELFEIKVSPAPPVRYIGSVVSKDVDNYPFVIKEFIRMLDENQYS
ncbi:MAG TPA: hypothetical protein DDW54_00165 [Clostridiales bacterium]|nr:hypothetical protein [Clostridiales bacterium]